MTQAKLQEILEAHKRWIVGESDGSRADLSDADLSRANLRDANLRGANLRGANLCDAEELAAPLRLRIAELESMPALTEDEEHAAYDAAILACRLFDSAWKAAKPQVTRLRDAQRSGARERMLQKLMEIKEEITKCL